jgi:hypothetical protein
METFEGALHSVLIPAGHRHAQPMRKEVATGFQTYSAVCTCNECDA